VSDDTANAYDVEDVREGDVEDDREATVADAAEKKAMSDCLFIGRDDRPCLAPATCGTERDPRCRIHKRAARDTSRRRRANLFRRRAMLRGMVTQAEALAIADDAHDEIMHEWQYDFSDTDDPPTWLSRDVQHRWLERSRMYRVWW